MPELPEVETMVRGLRPALVGRRIRKLEILDPFLLAGCSPAELARHGRGATVEELARRGKWVVVSLAAHRGIIVIQPRMTGGFWLLEPERPDHIRLVFHLDDPRAMIWFCDTRRLGKIHWYRDAEDAVRAFERVAWARRTGNRAGSARRATFANRSQHQAGLDGSKGTCGNRQYLRRRDPAPRENPPRTRCPHALRHGARPVAPGHRRRIESGDHPGRFQLRRRLSHSSWPRRGLSRSELRLRARKAALSRVFAADLKSPDRRTDRAINLLLPAMPSPTLT